MSNGERQTCGNSSLMTIVMISNTHRQRIARSLRGQAAEYLGDIFALKATARAALAIVFVCLELIPLHDNSIRANNCAKFNKYTCSSLSTLGDRFNILFFHLFASTEVTGLYKNCISIEN
jgi:hypothetical protein